VSENGEEMKKIEGVS